MKSVTQGHQPTIYTCSDFVIFCGTPEEMPESAKSSFLNFIDKLPQSPQIEPSPLDPNSKDQIKIMIMGGTKKIDGVLIAEAIERQLRPNLTPLHVTTVDNFNQKELPLFQGSALFYSDLDDEVIRFSALVEEIENLPRLIARKKGLFLFCSQYFVMEYRH